MLRGAQRPGEELWPLLVVPAPVVAADGVVVRDRAAVVEDRPRDRGFDRVPLLELRAGTGRRDERVVRSRAIGIDVREPAGDEHAAARSPSRVLERGRHARVELLEPVPRDRGLDGAGEHAHAHEPFVDVRQPEEGRPPGRCSRSVPNRAAVSCGRAPLHARAPRPPAGRPPRSRGRGSRSCRRRCRRGAPRHDRAAGSSPDGGWSSRPRASPRSHPRSARRARTRPRETPLAPAAGPRRG